MMLTSSKTILPGALGNLNIGMLPISNRTVFLDTAGVRISRGISADKVNELVESGKLLWVFNVGRKPDETHIRNLRFWLPEILDPSAVSGMCLDQVISRILPASRNSFNGSEIGQLFLISRPTVMRIGKEIGSVVNHRLLQFERRALARYLAVRWIGASQLTEKAFAT